MTTHQPTTRGEVLAELNAIIDGHLADLGLKDTDIKADNVPRFHESVESTAYLLARTTKLATEVGEALQALESRLGLNFRKGITGSYLAVHDELLDVAATALLAHSAIFGGTDSHEDLELHLRHLLSRAQTHEDGQ